ncbi:MAG: SDR family oxidoreductase [Sterolibacteriaceae bacterium]|nr:SDR family oxidoreductase [Sterolibacteriaceae bacterium]
MRRLLIIGCGDVAKRALPWLARRFRVFALVRNASDDAVVRVLGAVPLRGDLDKPATLRRLAGIAHCVLYAAPPQDRGTSDKRTRKLLAALATRASLPQRISYISTSGVYGDCMGERVDETRSARPVTPRARRRVDAERALRDFGIRSRCGVAILRAPGIYAADRLPIERLRSGDPVLTAEDDVFTNHIHAVDLARLAGMALFRARGGRVFNASDDSDLRMGDYFDLVADALGLAHPPRVRRSVAGERLSPVTMSFMSESRRLINNRFKRELRVKLRFPQIRDGLRTLAEC